MKLKNGSFYIMVVAAFCSSIVSAQSQQHDTTFTAISVNNAIKVYHQIMNKASGLYNGGEYDNYFFSFEAGSPYFGVKDSVPGSILYDGVLYRNIFMKYDEVRDAIVIWNDNEAIQLLNEKVGNFRLLDHSFTRLIKDNHSKDLVKTGFYEQLYKGRIAVFKKVIKTIIDKPDMTDGILRSIEQKTYFYLQTARGYTLVNNKSDLTEALKDHKKEITEFIGSGNLSFKQDPAGFLAKVAAYYDTL
ncbi:MAG TPA: hypothetical protein VF974_01865 [Patescibacteria group bacterium]